MVKSACNAGDAGLIPGSGRSPREGNGNPLQYSCLENPMNRGAWWDIVHGVSKESDTTEQLNKLLEAIICGVLHSLLRGLQFYQEGCRGTRLGELEEI